MGEQALSLRPVLWAGSGGKVIGLVDGGHVSGRLRQWYYRVLVGFGSQGAGSGMGVSY